MPSLSEQTLCFHLQSQAAGAGEQVGAKMSIFPLRWQAQALNALQNKFPSPAQEMQPPVGRRVGNGTPTQRRGSRGTLWKMLSCPSKYFQSMHGVSLEAHDPKTRLRSAVCRVGKAAGPQVLHSTHFPASPQQGVEWVPLL